MPRLVVDEIVTMYDMDPKGYVKGVKAVSAANKELQDSKKKAGLSGGNNVVKLTGMTAADFDPVQSALRGLTKVGIAAAAAVGAAGFAAKKAFENYAEFEAMELALAAVEGGAKEAEKAIKRLREAAKAPGLEFGEAVSGYLQIRRSGADQGFAEALVKQIGNANALGGGGKETFSRALLAVSQMLMKPFLQGEELLQLMEAGIPAAKIVKDRFGTADTEMLKKQGISSEQVLQGILQELEKLPRVAGGAKNTLENFNSALHFMSVSIGEAVAQVATKPLEALSASVDKFTDAGVWQDAITSFAESLGLISDEATGADDILLDIAAGFMTLGDHLELFKANLDGLYQFVKGWAKNWLNGPLGFLSEGLWNMVGVSPKAWANSEDSLSQDLFPSFENNRRELELKLKLDEKKKEREQKKDGSATPVKKDPLTSPPQFASAIPVLRQIAENTDPLKAISAQILGGGTLAKNAINRQDLSELGGRSGDWKQDVVRAIEQAVRGEIAARMVGRREV
jgi:tape measure domain-containing protein